MPNRDTLADRLRQARERAGLSQAGLADRSGVPVPTIRSIEQGQRTDPYASTLAALARALGVRMEELLG